MLVCVSLCPVDYGKTAADRIWIQFGMVGRMGPGIRQVVGFGDRSTRGGNFGGEYGAPRCNQWRVCGVDVCGVAVRNCVNCRSCGLGWCVGSAEALLATRPISKLLWAILLLFYPPFIFFSASRYATRQADGVDWA